MSDQARQFWQRSIACLALIAAFVTPALADKRVALVVGNSNYRHVPTLANPANDARLMADTLRALGFAIVGDGAQLDLDKPGFDAVVQKFGQQLQGADVGLFYYAGHGVQVRGANYLVPVAANPIREADVDFQMLDVSLVLRQMEGAGTRLNLVILDACRNNPFGGRGLRSADAGLAQMRAPEGTLISFATQPGNVALDGSAGNSPYTHALAQTIRKPGLGLFDAFNEVGLAVKKSTGGAQQPWVSSSPIAGTFHFAATPAVPPAPAKSVSATPAPPAAPPAQPAAPQPSPAATAFWQARQVGTCGALEAFVRRFPESFEATLALEHIKANCAAAAPPKPPAVAALPPAQPSQPARRTFRILESVSQGILNVRAGPGVRHDLVASIPAGASDVLLIGRCRMPDDGGKNPWCQVEWRGKSGWASSCCMVDVKTGVFARIGD